MSKKGSKKKIEIEIIALSHTMSNKQNYAVVLGEMGGSRRLPIVIGGFEAQAIAVALERMIPSRPLTHDLFKQSFETFNISLLEVLISELFEGVFYSKLVCRHNNELFEIDSRTSDALALAVRFECPIYTYEFILEEAGVMLEDQGSPDLKSKSKEEDQSQTLMNIPDQTLSKMLEEELEQENYEKAAQIRDELNKRKTSS